MTQPYQRGPRAGRPAARPGTRPGDRHALKAGKPLDIRDALAERYKGPAVGGRALDAIAPRLEIMAGTAGARATGEFGIDVSRLHRYMTSMSVHGAYSAEGQDADLRVRA